MPMTQEQILAEAKALDPAARAALIEDLRQLPDDDEMSPELHAELRRRIEAVERGESKPIPGEQVMRELRERLERR